MPGTSGNTWRGLIGPLCEAPCLQGVRLVQIRTEMHALLQAIQQKFVRGRARYLDRLAVLVESTPLTETEATHVMSFLVSAGRAPVENVAASVICVPCNRRFFQWADVLDDVANSLAHLPPDLEERVGI